jgi:hypothetical protein
MRKQLEAVLKQIAPLAHIPAPAADEDDDYIDLAQMEAEDGDDEPVDLSDEPGEDEDRPNSVVKGAYKAKYRARAREMARKPKGVAQKALERSCADWLAVELAKRTLTEGKKPSLIVPAFEAILDANGVKHAHWNRTTPGWQGRLRMTGRLALQRIVAEANELALPGEAPLTPPKAWVAKHAN